MRGKPKRAAVITAFDPAGFTGGIESYTLMLLELLKAMDLEADVFHTGMDYARTDKFHNSFLTEIYNLGVHFGTVDKEYDLVLSNSYYSMGYFPPRVRSINIYHSTHAGFARRVEGFIDDATLAEWRCLWGYAAEALSGAGKRAVAVSSSVGAELEEYYGLSGVRVVETGIDTGLFRRVDEKKKLREKYGVPARARVGLFVGRWHETKGTEALIGAAHRMGDVHWVVAAGSGGAVPVQRLGRNATVLNEVPRADMKEVYSLSDFMVFPSLYEGFGLVVVEAMAAGLPVLSTPVGISAEIFSSEPFDAMLLPNTRDAVEMAEAIKDKVGRLFDEDGGELGKRLSEEGRRLAAERFSLKKWGLEMSAVIEDALKGDAPSPNPMAGHISGAALRSIKGIDELLFMFKNSERERARLSAEAGEQIEKIGAVESSAFWKAAKAYYRVRDAVLPEGTGRRRVYDRAMKGMKTKA